MGGKWQKKLSPKDGFKKFIFGIKHELAKLCFVLYTQSLGYFLKKMKMLDLFLLISAVHGPLAE